MSDFERRQYGALSAALLKVFGVIDARAAVARSDIRSMAHGARVVIGRRFGALARELKQAEIPV